MYYHKLVSCIKPQLQVNCSACLQGFRLAWQSYLIEIQQMSLYGAVWARAMPLQPKVHFEAKKGERVIKRWNDCETQSSSQKGA